MLIALLGASAQAADANPAVSAFARALRTEARGVAEVSVFFPPRANPTRTAAVLPNVSVYAGLLRRNFEVNVGGVERVAGRDATRLTLTPKVGDAARWTVWVDRAWNVPLAFEERSADGTLARRAALQQVSGVRARSRAAPVRPEGLRRAVLAAVPGLACPAGFEPVAVSVSGRGTEVQLSDGLNTLVLVLATRNVQTAPGVAARRVRAGAFVWLIGNLPARALSAALTGVRDVRPDALGTFVAPPPSKE
ncbi:putative sigma E regulatory protein, MucB/RseB [Deinococcus maricopensis DSM 21211]|uniref:Putative sigma E regulatory protein, MucB/RseB n=2 Tax=Deinococcus TaxID=1298 RepID=E8U5M9_DEIML|nr:putative sigma E regulatory protein, MucB/RseB [Deinococcus maricopensis DSM 21211]